MENQQQNLIRQVPLPNATVVLVLGNHIYSTVLVPGNCWLNTSYSCTNICQQGFSFVCGQPTKFTR